MLSIIPDPLRSYLRWWRTRRRFAGATIAQSAVVSLDSKMEPPCVIHARSQIQSSHLGAYSYAGIDSALFCAEVGRFCSIANRSTIGGGMHPTRDWVSTSPVFFSTGRQAGITFVTDARFQEHTQTIIGNDVWIGQAAIVLPGVKIGNGAIVGAGSVVTKDVDDYAIVAGVPAKTIRYRFDPAEVRWLLERRWWDESESWLRENAIRFAHLSTFRKIT